MLLSQGQQMSAEGLSTSTVPISARSAQQIVTFLENRERPVPEGLQALVAGKMSFNLKPYQLQTLAFMMGEHG